MRPSILPGANLNIQQLLSCRTKTQLLRCQHKLQSRHLFAWKKPKSKPKMSVISRYSLIGVTSVVIGSSLVYILYQNDQLQPLPPTRLSSELRALREKRQAVAERIEEVAAENARICPRYLSRRTNLSRRARVTIRHGAAFRRNSRCFLRSRIYNGVRWQTRSWIL